MAAPNQEKWLDLIPAYALGVLDEDERAGFEAWLQHDPEAQMILADYQTIAEHLVALAPLRRAPEHLQADLRQRLAASRQGTVAAPSVEQAPKRARRLLSRPRVWIFAAAALIVVILAVLLIRPWTDDESEPTARRLFKQLEAQPGSREYEIVAGEVNDAVWGFLLVSSLGDQAVLCMWDLPAITDEQIFQMWLVDEAGSRTSVGLFQGDPSQPALFIEVPLDRPVSAYQGLGVSLEPAGGSPYADQPTGPRVLSVPLS